MSHRSRESVPNDRGANIAAASRIAKFWWIGAVRGVIAVILGTSVLLASGRPERLPTLLAFYWVTGGIVTVRFAWAIRPSAGFRLGMVAGVIAITAALLVALREFLSGVASADKVIDLLGIAAAATGALRLVGAFELERHTGHRWSVGGLVLGSLEIGTGILLLSIEARSQGVMIFLGTWALASGSLLLIEALRARRLASAILKSDHGSRDARPSGPEAG